MKLRAEMSGLDTHCWVSCHHPVNGTSKDCNLPRLLVEWEFITVKFRRKWWWEFSHWSLINKIENKLWLVMQKERLNSLPVLCTENTTYITTKPVHQRADSHRGTQTTLVQEWKTMLQHYSWKHNQQKHSCSPPIPSFFNNVKINN